MVITASAVVSFSVLSIGFASGPSVLAGSVVGSTVGGTFTKLSPTAPENSLGCLVG